MLEETQRQVAWLHEAHQCLVLCMTSLHYSAGIQALLTARQDAHVKQFLQTEAACQAGRVARDQALYLQTNDHR